MEVGDRVLLANKGERGKRKLVDRWENTLYVVTEKNSDIHVYKIRNSSTGQEKTVHRNHIMPVNFLPLLDSPEQVIDEVRCSSDESDAPVDMMNAEERTSVWVSELSSEVPDDERTDHMEEEYRSSVEHGLIPDSNLLSDVPVEVAVDGISKSVSDSGLMDSDFRLCVSNSGCPPTPTHESAQANDDDFGLTDPRLLFLTFSQCRLIDGVFRGRGVS